MKLDKVCHCNIRDASQYKRGGSWCQNNFKGKSKGQVHGRGAKQVEFKIVARLRLRTGEQDSDRGRFQVQGTDNTRFKVHSRAGGVHGRDKRMLEVQDNNKSNLTCSAVEAHCGATTRLEVYGSVRTRININTRTREG